MTTRQCSRLPLIGAALAIAFAFFGSAALAAMTDKQAVLAANTAFYAALNKMFIGESAPIEAVWSHGDDVLYMGPGGETHRGWSDIVQDWQRQAAMKLGGHVENTGVKSIVGRDLAVVTNTEVGENTNANGVVTQVKIRATNVFRKEAGHWKMVVHHTDLLPYLAK